MEKSAAFYEGILGWKRDPRPEMGFPGAWYKVGDGMQIHLMTAEKPDHLPKQAGQRGGLDSHFAVRIPNFDAVLAILKEKGYSIHEGKMGNKRRFFTRDPDYNLVELWET